MTSDTLTVGPYRIAPELFARGFETGKGPCSCATHCCAGGVWMDLRDRDRILEHRDAIARAMDPEQVHDHTRWFGEEEPDDDFPSGRSIETTVQGNGCVFLDRQGRCSVQVAAVTAGLHKWAWKPLYCVLFPLEVSEGTVCFDDMLQEEQVCCTVTDTFTTPLFRGCREELEHLLGREGYAALERHYESTAAHPAPAGKETP